MSKNEIRTYVVLCIIFIAFSSIAFAAPFDKNTVFGVAYLFGVLSILVQIYVYKVAYIEKGNARSAFYGLPIINIGLTYITVQIIVSIIEMIIAKEIPLWPVIIANVIILAIASVGCIAAETVRDEIVRQDTNDIQNKVQIMRELQSISGSLVTLCTDDNLKKEIQKLADEFRYSDPVSSEQTSDLENQLKSKLNELQKLISAGNFDNSKGLCADILSTLTERNRICKNSK
jgi:hypothetical protein